MTPHIVALRTRACHAIDEAVQLQARLDRTLARSRHLCSLVRGTSSSLKVIPARRPARRHPADGASSSELPDAVEQLQMVELAVHDLANSLAAAKLCATAMAAPAPGSAQPPRDYFPVLRRALLSMEGLVDDLRDLRRQTSGRFVIDATAPASPAALVAAAIDAEAPWEYERTIGAACAPGLPEVRVDEHRIQRVFANLIGNAIKFTRRGATITVGAMPGTSPGEVTFFVRDNGDGIGEEDRQSLFERYWRGKANRAPGSGLGLTICRGIVEAHGGRMSVMSRPGEGSTFGFTLPPLEHAERFAMPDGDVGFATTPPGEVVTHGAA